ncbi:MAG TPA: YbgC/FadM family acyl-CoA thioesterase [Roseiarcus sp.]|nr:YbgC/FadM family acyl-CoA thioesterase [Roseiarcus sp.]
MPHVGGCTRWRRAAGGGSVDAARNYEDTDFSGRVYHASYLRFLERGRTEWLRARGFEQRDMAAGVSMIFVVRRLKIDFVKPATMDDMLVVETGVAALGAASLEFSQRILREEETLAVATICVAALRNGKPTRMPAEIRTRLGARR